MEIGSLPIVGSRLFAIQMLSSARVGNDDPLIKVKTIQGGIHKSVRIHIKFCCN